MHKISEAIVNLRVILLEMKSEGVKQGAVEVTVTGMNHKSSLFIYDDDVIIFIHHVKAYFFREDGDLPRRICQDNRHNIKRFHLIVWFDRLVIDKDAACLCRILNPVTRYVFQTILQKLIHTHQCLSLISHYPEMLEQLGILLIVLSYYTYEIFRHVTITLKQQFLTRSRSRLLRWHATDIRHLAVLWHSVC